MLGDRLQVCPKAESPFALRTCTGSKSKEKQFHEHMASAGYEGSSKGCVVLAFLGATVLTGA